MLSTPVPLPKPPPAPGSPERARRGQQGMSTTSPSCSPAKTHLRLNRASPCCVCRAGGDEQLCAGDPTQIWGLPQARLRLAQLSTTPHGSARHNQECPERTRGCRKPFINLVHDPQDAGEQRSSPAQGGVVLGQPCRWFRSSVPPAPPPCSGSTECSCRCQTPVKCTLNSGELGNFHFNSNTN